MIRIEHISFEFAAADERFVHDLYADWDGFCRNYFEKTVDECLSPLDKDKVLHEIELLELDLGSIPEENFYREFPRRLKAELLKVLPSWGILTESERKRRMLHAWKIYCSIWNMVIRRWNGTIVLLT